MVLSEIAYMTDEQTPSEVFLSDPVLQYWSDYKKSNPVIYQIDVKNNHGFTLGNY